MLRQIVLFALLLSNCHGKFRFDNYTVYEITPSNEEKLKSLQSLFDNPELYFMEDPLIQNSVHVVTSPSYKKYLDEILTVNELTSQVLFTDLQSVMDKQTVGNYVTRNIRSMTWDKYYRLDDIYAWLEDLAATNSDRVTIIVGGVSYEGHDIKGVKISTSPSSSGRKSIFIEGGIHAREWISPATVNFIISELLFSNDPETKAACNDFDWYLFPVTNPDGYIWTHEEFRLWRKNRRPVGNEYGIDLNRNWNSNWLLKGSSTNPASNTYAGDGPFSEPETRTLSQYIQSVANNMEMYLSFHSSGQMLMVPYGNTTDALENYNDTVKIGRRAMGSLAVRYGTMYVTGNIAETIYECTGTSIDWVKEKLGVPLTYVYELRDRGQYGHLLPADQILPNNLEVMDSVLALIREARALGYFNSSSSTKASLITLLFSIIVYLKP